MKRIVTVSIDGRERQLAAGLRIRHLLSPGEVALAEAGELAVHDADGNQRGLDGALSDGLALFTRRQAG
jgi:hypothetical protein